LYVSRNLRGMSAGAVVCSPNSVLARLRMSDIRLEEPLVCLEAKLAIPVSDLDAVGL
jgi:hypothetical protein